MPPRGARAKPAGQPAPAFRAKARASVKITEEDLSSFNGCKNILLYGDSGVGKTVTAGGIATPNRKAVFMSTETGVVSAKRTGSSAKLYRAMDWDHVEASLDKADAELSQDDWLIADSGTRMQTLNLRWILQNEHESRDADLDTPQLQHYPKWQNMFRRFVDRMVDAPYNVLMTATAMHLEDVEGEPIIVPNFQGSNKDPLRESNYVCAQMDSVFYLGLPRLKKSDTPVRRILTESYPPYFAKNRYSGTLEKYVDFEAGEYDIMAWIIDQMEAPVA